jgi:hypothetical protein
LNLPHSLKSVISPCLAKMFSPALPSWQTPDYPLVISSKCVCSQVCILSALQGGLSDYLQEIFSHTCIILSHCFGEWSIYQVLPYFLSLM